MSTTKMKMIIIVSLASSTFSKVDEGDGKRENMKTRNIDGKIPSMIKP